MLEDQNPTDHPSDGAPNAQGAEGGATDAAGAEGGATGAEAAAADGAVATVTRRRRAASRPAGPPATPAVSEAEAPAKPVKATRTRKKAASKASADAAGDAEAAQAAGAADGPAASTDAPPQATVTTRTRKKAATRSAGPADPAPTDAEDAAATTGEEAPTVEDTTASAAPGDTAPDQPATEDAAPEEPVAEDVVSEEPVAEDVVSEEDDDEAAAPAARAPFVAPLFRAPEPTTAPRRRRRPADETEADDQSGDARSDLGRADDDTDEAGGADDSADLRGDSDDEETGAPARRRRRRGGRRRRRSGGDDADAAENAEDASAEGAGSDNADSSDESDESDTDGSDEASGSSSSRRRRRRRRRGEDGDSGSSDDPENTVVKVRERRSPEDEITSVSGSTRLEAKKQRRREGREAGRRRVPIVSEAEFLARRESVKREMVIRQRADLTQIAVLEDDVLVEHYVARDSQTSMIGNVYLGRVQNVLPSMEAAFVDIGKGRNAVLYAGEVDWSKLGDGKPRKIEEVLKSGQTVLVQVTKDPIGHKGARLTSQISLPGRFLVYVPGGQTSGISRKLPDTERNRLKSLLKSILPEDAGVIIRTAAEGATEEQLTRDVEALDARWKDIEKKSTSGSAPSLLYGEPDLTIKVVRDLFNEDFSRLVVEGDDAAEMIEGYVAHVAPDLKDRVETWQGSESGDVFSAHRIDEQIAKALDRKVWLPSGGSLIIDRTEAMTVVDVNTGKFTGSGGNLEETVTKNNLEAAEEIVRQLRLRDIGGIIVVDFIDMVLESNRDLVLRRLVECLGRDRTRHQVAEVTSLGLVQMTRKRIGTGLLEAFSEPCEHCGGRGLILHEHPVEPKKSTDDNRRGRGGRGGRRGNDGDAQKGGGQNDGNAKNSGGKNSGGGQKNDGGGKNSGQKGEAGTKGGGSSEAEVPPAASATGSDDNGSSGSQAAEESGGGRRRRRRRSGADRPSEQGGEDTQPASTESSTDAPTESPVESLSDDGPRRPVEEAAREEEAAVERPATLGGGDPDPVLTGDGETP